METELAACILISLRVSFLDFSPHTANAINTVKDGETLILQKSLILFLINGLVKCERRASEDTVCTIARVNNQITLVTNLSRFLIGA